MLGSLIGAGASLLGGLFGRSSEKKAIAAQNEYNKPINIRARAEEAGFNPLLFVGPGVGQQTTAGGSNYLGSAIADAGLIVAEGMARKKEELGKVAKLQEANQKLQQQIQSLTLRPKVGGIYAQREATPTLAAALGGSGVRSGHVLPVDGGSISDGVLAPDGSVSTGLRPLPSRSRPSSWCNFPDGLRA